MSDTLRLFCISSGYISYMEEKHHIDTLAYICLKDGKILSTRSKGKDAYYIPGGKRDGEETDEQALIREVKEEIMVDLIPETIKYYGTFKAQAHGKPEGMMVQAKCYTADFNGEPQPGSEKEEIVWLGHDEREQSSPLDRLIFDDLKAKGLLA